MKKTESFEMSKFVIPPEGLCRGEIIFNLGFPEIEKVMVFASHPEGPEGCSDLEKGCSLTFLMEKFDMHKESVNRKLSGIMGQIKPDMLIFTLAHRLSCRS